MIFEFQDDLEFWDTLGIAPPPLPPGGEFGPEGALPPGGEFAPLPPVFVPPPEQLEFIRGDDKDSKKDAIFNLAGQDGGLSGLVSTLAEDELNDLIFEFQDDLEFWDTLGIAPPALPPVESVAAGTSLAGEDAVIDTPLTDEGVALVGVGSGDGI